MELPAGIASLAVGQPPQEGLHGKQFADGLQ